MPTVVIPAQLRKLTGNVAAVEVQATSVDQALDELDGRFPGIRARLCQDGRIRAGLAVAVDGTMSSRGLLQKLQPESEVHFLPAIGGG